MKRERLEDGGLNDSSNRVEPPVGYLDDDRLYNGVALVILLRDGWC